MTVVVAVSLWCSRGPCRRRGRRRRRGRCRSALRLPPLVTTRPLALRMSLQQLASPSSLPLPSSPRPSALSCCCDYCRRPAGAPDAIDVITTAAVTVASTFGVSTTISAAAAPAGTVCVNIVATVRAVMSVAAVQTAVAPSPSSHQEAGTVGPASAAVPAT